MGVPIQEAIPRRCRDPQVRVEYVEGESQLVRHRRRDRHLRDQGRKGLQRVPRHQTAMPHHLNPNTKEVTINPTRRLTETVTIRTALPLRCIMLRLKRTEISLLNPIACTEIHPHARVNLVQDRLQKY